MSDRPGVVAPVWRPTLTHRFARDAQEPLPAPAAGSFGDDAARTYGPKVRPESEPLRAFGSARWPERGLAAIVTATLAAWLIATLVPRSPVAPFAVALVAGTLVAALPRLGWATFVVALAAWLSLEGRTGAAVVIAIGFLPALLAPRRGPAWSLPAGAPALGVIGLAGAWPALAARARRAPMRAALGAVGWTWTALGTALSGADLHLRAPPGSPPPARWTPSAGAALHRVLEPLITSGALAPALVWAAAAVILPWLVRGRRVAVDFVLASGWAAGLVAATYASLRMVHGSLAAATLSHAVLGGLAAFVVAFAPSVLRTYERSVLPRKFP